MLGTMSEKQSASHKVAIGQGQLRLPSIAHIRAFEAAVRLGSFERASEDLSITPSGVSKRVSALEALLGIKLLSRMGRGVVPTPAGNEYLEQVSVALGLLSRSSYHSNASTIQRRLRVTLPPTFTRQLLIPHLAEFTAAHPDIELELLLSIPFLDISAPGCDLEVRFGDGSYDGFESELLVDEPVFPVCTPRYLADIGGLERPLDLRKAALLRSPLEPWRPWFDKAELNWQEPETGHRFTDLGMLLEGAINDQGVTLARRSLAVEALAHGRLIRPFGPLEARPLFAYYICWPRKTKMEPAKRKFVDWLKAVCHRAAAPPPRPDPEA
jgi:LysR family transcriptional regulator, glycine cleavage system transcriptional activator